MWCLEGAPILFLEKVIPSHGGNFQCGLKGRFRRPFAKSLHEIEEFLLGVGPIEAREFLALFIDPGRSAFDGPARYFFNRGLKELGKSAAPRSRRGAAAFLAPGRVGRNWGPVESIARRHLSWTRMLPSVSAPRHRRPRGPRYGPCAM